MAQPSSSAIERPVMPHLVRRLLRGPCSWAGLLRCREIRGKPAAVPPGRCGMGGAFDLLVSPVGVVPGPAGRHGPPQLVHNDHRHVTKPAPKDPARGMLAHAFLRRPAGTHPPRPGRTGPRRPVTKSNACPSPWSPNRTTKSPSDSAGPPGAAATDHTPATTGRQAASKHEDHDLQLEHEATLGTWPVRQDWKPCDAPMRRP